MAAISETNYERYLRSEHWYRTRLQRIRLSIMAHPPVVLDTVLCNACERFVWEGRIQVHHRTYKNLGNERMLDLAVLCEGCHANEHGLPAPDWWHAANKTGLMCIQESYIKQFPGRENKAVRDVIYQALEAALTRAELFDASMSPR